MLCSVVVVLVEAVRGRKSYVERWSCENREDMQGPATRSRQRACTQDARDRALHVLALLMDVTDGERLRRRMHGLERRRAAAACRGYRGKGNGGEALQKPKAVMDLGHWQVLQGGGLLFIDFGLQLIFTCFWLVTVAIQSITRPK